jgi:hypothetical protein
VCELCREGCLEEGRGTGGRVLTSAAARQSLIAAAHPFHAPPRPPPPPLLHIPLRPRDTLQSETALKLLDTMEEHYVIPESSTNSLLIRRFGQASPAVNKSRRMAFWMRRPVTDFRGHLQVLPRGAMEEHAHDGSTARMHLHRFSRVGTHPLQSHFPPIVQVSICRRHSHHPFTRLLPHSLDHSDLLLGIRSRWRRCQRTRWIGRRCFCQG